jgi:hypothetical protein
MTWPTQHARATDPRTSHDAAAQVTAANTQLRELASVYLTDYRADGDGLTSDEACELAGCQRGGWRRVSDLISRGVIADTGRTRPGKSGRGQRVLRWVPVDERQWP